MINTAKFIKLLQSKREEIIRLLDENSASDTKPVELDQQIVGRLSRMDAMQVQAMAIETKRRRQAELVRINEALKRLESDDYGYCLNCGEEIAEKRLLLNPSVANCVNCSNS